MRHSTFFRRSMACVVVLLATAASLSLLSSCGDESHYLGSQEEREANGFYIDDIRTHIETAAFFYTEERQGYNVFFSSKDENLASGKVSDTPSRRYFSVDVPISALGKRMNLKEVNDDDPNHFNFQIVCGHVTDASLLTASASNITEGYVELNFTNEWIDSNHKQMEFEVYAVLNNGRVVKANYKGSAQISKKYIGWWGRETIE